MQLWLLSTLLLVAQSTTVIVYYMMCLSAVLTSCREFKMHAPDLSLCRANSATLPPVLHQLHWLPFSFCINFKILLLTFKAIHELAPSYINDLVKLEPWNSRFRLRFNDRTLLLTRILKLKKPWATMLLLPRRLNSGTIYLWKLERPNLWTLKKFLKKHLFSKAFHS